LSDDDSFLCPSETPEGQQCGIVKHLAMLCYLSIDHPIWGIMNWIRQWGDRTLHDLAFITESNFDPAGWRVVINGRLICSFKNDPREPDGLIDQFKRARARGQIARTVSISLRDPDRREVRFWSDGGRVYRPACVVNNGKLALTRRDMDRLQERADGISSFGIENLLRERKVEYLDASETEDTLIAMKFSDVCDPDTEAKRDLLPQLTHCEVSPYAILGVSAALIPFAEHNQSPRNVYVFFFPPPHHLLTHSKVSSGNGKTSARYS
jgi:DNA-directed RNA polymerase beta subunit